MIAPAAMTPRPCRDESAKVKEFLRNVIAWNRVCAPVLYRGLRKPRPRRPPVVVWPGAQPPGHAPARLVLVHAGPRAPVAARGRGRHQPGPLALAAEEGRPAMFGNLMVALEWLGLVAFAVTGALVASRAQMDAVGFVALGTVTGIGGGTVRDLLLDAHPLTWIEEPALLAACVAVSLVVFFTAHLFQSRLRLILWADAIGLALFATVGAERALAHGAPPAVAIAMGGITAVAGGIVRDVLAGERSIIFARELYITAALAAAAAFVALGSAGVPREGAVLAGVAAGLGLRAGALARGWALPRYRPRPPRAWR